MDITLIIPVVAILSSVALPIGFGMYIALASIRAEHKEKMESIRLGLPYTPSKKDKTPNKYASLRNGFLCIGVALGAILGMIAIKLADLSEEWASLVLPSSIILMLGIAYVIYFFIAERQEKQDNDIN